MNLSLHFSVLFVFTTIVSTVFSSESENWKHRKLSTQKIGVDTAYVKAVGPHDTLHYLFDGGNELSILSIKTTPVGNLIINKTVSPPQIKIEPEKSFLFAFGIVFERLIEYNDSDDKASLIHYNTSSWIDYSTSMEILSIKDNNVTFQKNLNSGNVSFSFHNFADDSRQDILPHLIVSSNSTLIDLVIDGVEPSFHTSRFALETSYLSYDKSTFSIKSEKSLDDEYTPGTFEVSNWVAENHYKGFLQWKPVCYFGPNRNTQTSTYVKSYTLDIITNDTTPSNSSLAHNFFEMRDSYSMSRNFISFGRTEDKFYNRERYTAWAATFGYGDPPAETVSTMAIAIISVGLGIPVLLFIGGGIFLCVKRRRMNSDYEQVFGTISS